MKRILLLISCFVFFVNASRLFAHNITGYASNCASGPQYIITASVNSANSTSNYRWQYRLNSTSPWNCLTNGSNIINGNTYNISGAVSDLTTTPSPLIFTNPNINLQGIEIRMVISDGAGVNPCTMPSGNTWTSTTNHFINLSNTICDGATTNCTIGGLNVGTFTNYLFVFTDGSGDANWQGSSKGFVGNVIVDGIKAVEKTSGTVPFAGVINTNDATLSAWDGIIIDNSSQALAIYNQTTLVNGFSASIENVFTQVNALPASSGYTGVSSTSLNGLNTQNSIAETFVINVTSGFNITSKINITGDAADVFIMRWDSDANFADGYEGQVKFSSGGAIVPLGGLTAGNFIHVAGDLGAGGGGSNPSAPYPQGPRTNNGTGSLISGGSDFNGGGFFTGYWFTTGNPTITGSGQPYGQTSSLGNAIFVGGWYSKTSKFSMTSGTSGVYVSPQSCNQNTLSLGNYVWNDINKNGYVDPGEPALSGVTVKLYKDDNDDEVIDNTTPIATTTTNANGLYSFTGLTSGLYIVGVVPPAGFSIGINNATSDEPDADVDNDNNGVITLASGEVTTKNVFLSLGAEPTNDGDWANSNLTVDIGLINEGNFGSNTGSVCYESPTKPTIVNSIQEWRSNGNGTITIRTTLSKTFVDNTYGTNAIGWPSGHTFGNLTGSDQVTVALFDANGVKKLEFKQDYFTADASAPSGYKSKGVAGGDGGMISGNPVYILDWKTSMDVNFNDYGYVLTTNSPSTNSSYAPNGTYPNWIYDVWYEITVDEDAFGTAGFGYPRMTGVHASPSKTGNNSESVIPVPCKALTLGNLVWIDTDNDGIKDAGEQPASGILVKLYADANGDNVPDGASIANTTTDGAGIYSFTGLPEGKYIVGVTLPTGFSATATIASSTNPDNNTDNDNNGINTVSGELRSNFITLNFNAEPTNDGDGTYGNLTLDFGIKFTGSIGDFVWHDKNANGLQDANEPGIPGVTVTANGPGGLRTTTTDATGFYMFTGLATGTYTVTFTTPSGYVSSPANQGANDFVDSDPVGGIVTVSYTAGTNNFSIDAGFYKSVNLGNLVWNDVNKNGLFDNGESGMSGLTVKLYNDANNDNVVDGAAIATTTTDGSGVYAFTNIIPGNYIVGVMIPNGFSNTLIPATGNDPDNDTNNDNNGITTTTGELRSNSIMLIAETEPTGDGDGANGNLTLDFGLFNPTDFGPYDGSKCYESPTKPGIVNATQYWRYNSNGTITFRTTFSKTFVDNTYGTSAIGWPSGHTWSNLTGSDQLTLALYDANGVKKLEFKQDYVSASTAAPSGFKSLVVSGGDGGMILGSASNVVGGKTSIDANFNDYGYVLTTNSPATDTVYTPNPTYPNWIYDVWYEVTVNASAFGAAGFGYPLISNVHASPSKTGNNTEIVLPIPCNSLKLGDVVWIDGNNNGLKDVGEQTVAGATVKLYNDANGDNVVDGAAIATTITDNNGNYLFTGLAQGKYIVGVVLPGGYSVGTTIASSTTPDNNTNNDNNGINLVGNEVRSNFITLSTYGEPINDGDDNNGNLTLDFGLKFIGSIGDFVWEDRNANGLQDANEPGIPGVTVTLNGPGGLQTTTTDANGFYYFIGLASGNYNVNFAIPSGYTSSPSNQGSNDFIDSDPVNGTVSVSYTAGTTNFSIDAGFYKQMQLGNLIWYDYNSDGIHQGAEPGLPGMVVKLYADANNDNVPDGAALQTTSTDGVGNYLFNGLVPGNYIVGVTLANGYMRSTVPGTGNDPDNNTDEDNNGINLVSGEVRTNNIMLAIGTEPNDIGFGFNTNLTLDIGLINTDFGYFDGKKCYSSPTKPTIVSSEQYWRLNADSTITIRTIFSKTFVDNTYGTGAIGWPSGHTFGNLTGSDQLTMALYDANGVKKMEFKQDYVSASASEPSGYGSLGVTGGEGRMLLGNSSNVVNWTTSIDENLNDLGYVLLTNSPTTDSNYSANATYPHWIYDVWYEVTVKASVFGTAGFGYPLITGIHASPSKTGSNTEIVNPGPCKELKLGNIVWFDANNNGLKDGAEQGIDGLTVRLFRDNNADNIPDGGPIAVTVTATGGQYAFSGLGAGNYIVGVVLPTGYVATTTIGTSSNPNNDTDNDNNGVITTSGVLRSNFITLTNAGEPTNDGDGNNGNLTLDFGLRGTAAIGDFVWNDQNINGIQNGGEPGIPNVTVTLNGPGGTQVTTTNASGNYNFTGLLPGSYTVTFTTPAGFVPSPSLQGSDTTKDSNPIFGIANVTIGLGQTNNTIDAGFYSMLNLGNQVWYDYNNNGLLDNNEVGIQGVTVNLYTDNNSDNIADGAAVSTTTTNASGIYQFTGLTPGNYIVGIVTPTGYVNAAIIGSTSNPNNDIDNDNNGINLVSGEIRSNRITLATGTEPTSGNTNNTLDFGLTGTGSIGDFVWADYNGNGIQDNSEPGVEGVIVTLTFPNGFIVRDTTDANGYYLFSNLPPGTYNVNFQSPIGATPSPANQGGDDNKDSDPIGGNVTVPLAFGQNRTDIDAGFVCCIENLILGNLVWNDNNGDGMYNLGEPLLSNVTVKLYKDNNGDNVPDGVALQTVLTNTSGIYQFNNLPAGKYIVGVTLPVGKTTTTVPGTGFNPNNLLDNDNNGVTVVSGEVLSNYITVTSNNFTLDFGLRNSGSGTGSIGDFVWNDLDKDGVQDANEPGIKNVMVTLKYPDSSSVVTTTNSDGYYIFPNLNAGTYKLIFTTPNGMMATMPLQGGNSSKDSDPVNGGVVVTITSGQSNTTIDAGFYLTTPALSACGEGFVTKATTLVKNGSFTNQTLTPGAGNTFAGTNATTGLTYSFTGGNFKAQAKHDGLNVRPASERGFTLINSWSNFNGGCCSILQAPFPGDPDNNIPASGTWLYHNGNDLGGEYLIWEQTLNGLVIGENYRFRFYASNTMEPTNDQSDPLIGIRIGGTTGLPNGTLVVSPVILDEASTANSAALSGWRRIEYAFVATSTSMTFKITDAQTAATGDEVGITAIGLDVCEKDTDKDGISDVNDIDADNDGIMNTIESGGYDPFSDCDGDGIQNIKDPIPGCVGLTWVDCNNDGINDFFDWDRDGIINALDLDSDNDGIPDVVETQDPNAVDNNNDGMVDGVDDDYDGLLSTADSNDNIFGGPGLTPKDLDRDGTPNYLDLDSDGDGITDITEATGNYDNDGVANGTDTDADGLRGSYTNGDTVGDDYNGFGGSGVKLLDSDNDGKFDPYDVDSDNDGISDNVEGQPTCSTVLPTRTDSDGDGVDNAYDISNNLCPRTSGGITPFDKEADGTPDYLDLDADNDGAPDVNEGSGLTGDFVTNFADTDGDGMIDQFDTFNIATALGNFSNNVGNSQMGPNGNFDGPVPSGSNVQLIRSTPGDCLTADRDWRECTILPVTLIEFKGNLYNNIANLNWTVIQEKGMEKYEVQRSIDGHNYVKVATVAARDIQTKITYAAQDNITGIATNIVYYKLRMFDKNGASKFSNVITFRLNGKKGGIAVNPNPVSNYFILRLNANNNGYANIRVVDLNGKLLIAQTTAVQKGSNTITFNDVSKMASGTYFVQVQMDGELFNEKLIVNK